MAVFSENVVVRSPANQVIFKTQPIPPGEVAFFNWNRGTEGQLPQWFWLRHPLVESERASEQDAIQVRHFDLSSKRKVAKHGVQRKGKGEIRNSGLYGRP